MSVSFVSLRSARVHLQTNIFIFKKVVEGHCNIAYQIYCKIVVSKEICLYYVTLHIGFSSILMSYSFENLCLACLACFPDPPKKGPRTQAMLVKLQDFPLLPHSSVPNFVSLHYSGFYRCTTRIVSMLLCRKSFDLIFDVSKLDT